MVARIAGRRVDGELPGRQGKALFAYLVLNRRRRVRREELRTAVWPETGPRVAANALDPLLSKVRRALGGEVIEGRAELTVRLPADAWVDVEAATDAMHRAESAVAQEQWKRAWGPAHIVIHTANRGFLPAHEAPWVDEQRERLDEMLLHALECLATAALGIGSTELPTAERAARRLIREAPLRESGHRLLMEVMAARGNVAEALTVHDRLKNLLRDELAIPPSGEVQAIYDRLLRSR